MPFFLLYDISVYLLSNVHVSFYSTVSALKIFYSRIYFWLFAIIETLSLLNLFHFLLAIVLNWIVSRTTKTKNSLELVRHSFFSFIPQLYANFLHKHLSPKHLKFLGQRNNSLKNSLRLPQRLFRASIALSTESDSTIQHGKEDCFISGLLCFLQVLICHYWISKFNLSCSWFRLNVMIYHHQ